MKFVQKAVVAYLLQHYFLLACGHAIPGDSNSDDRETIVGRAVFHKGVDGEKVEEE